MHIYHFSCKNVLPLDQNEFNIGGWVQFSEAHQKLVHKRTWECSAPKAAEMNYLTT